MAAQIQNYINYPPRQKAASFNLDGVMAQLDHAAAAKAIAAKAAEAKQHAEADHGVLVGK